MTSSEGKSQPAVQLTLIPPAALEALLAGSITRASDLTGLALPPAFLEYQWLWQYRLDQAREDPSSAPWLVRAVYGLPAQAVVGHAGFHGPPNEHGMVEIGYTIQPEFRRRGYGRAAALQLMEYAAASPDVTVVRASISPDNVASLALIHSLGFVQTGEQWDERDGLELVFERPPRLPRP
jgi:RimJ/RimL family protein N-acetyltransferase